MVSDLQVKLTNIASGFDQQTELGEKSLRQTEEIRQVLDTLIAKSTISDGQLRSELKRLGRKVDDLTTTVSQSAHLAETSHDRLLAQITETSTQQEALLASILNQMKIQNSNSSASSGPTKDVEETVIEGKVIPLLRRELAPITDTLFKLIKIVRAGSGEVKVNDEEEDIPSGDQSGDPKVDLSTEATLLLLQGQVDTKDSSTPPADTSDTRAKDLDQEKRSPEPSQSAGGRVTTSTSLPGDDLDEQESLPSGGAGGDKESSNSLEGENSKASLISGEDSEYSCGNNSGTSAHPRSNVPSSPSAGDPSEYDATRSQSLHESIRISLHLAYPHPPFIPLIMSSMAIRRMPQ